MAEIRKKMIEICKLHFKGYIYKLSDYICYGEDVFRNRGMRTYSIDKRVVLRGLIEFLRRFIKLYPPHEEWFRRNFTKMLMNNAAVEQIDLSKICFDKANVMLLREADVVEDEERKHGYFPVGHDSNFWCGSQGRK
jgi:hypothetical protein